MIEERTYEKALAYFLAPVADLLADPGVSEVMINGFDDVYVEQGGLLRKVPQRFESERALLACVRSIAQFSGKRVTEQEPRIDARLPDGSRVHVVLPPVARGGITLSIRKFSETALTLDRLVEYGSVSPAVRELLKLAVLLKRNVLVSGGTGSGKTSLLNALSGAIPGAERILVLEDTSELRLQQDHVVCLEARAADRHGRGEVTIRDLLHSSLRLRPDRVIVGECRGGEAFDMIQAMNTGHAGSMTTVHANSPRDALTRIESLSLLANVEIPLVPLRAQVASALHVVVQTGRLPDGSRKVLQVSEVLPLDDEGRYQTRTIATFMPSGRDADGRVQGDHVLADDAPTFWDDLVPAGFGDQVVALRKVWRG